MALVVMVVVVVGRLGPAVVGGGWLRVPKPQAVLAEGDPQILVEPSVGRGGTLDAHRLLVAWRRGAHTHTHARCIEHVFFQGLCTSVKHQHRRNIYNNIGGGHSA